MKVKSAEEHVLPSPLTAGHTLCCGFPGRQPPLTTHPQDKDGFYSHHPEHRGHSPPSARSGPQEGDPCWQQDAGGFGHAVNAKQTPISKQDVNITPGAGCAVAFPLHLRLAGDSYGFTLNSSLSQLTLAIGTMIMKKIGSKCENLQCIIFASHSLKQQVQK